MMIKRGALVFLFVVLFAFSVKAASLTSCSISTTGNCGSDATALFKMSERFNAHAGTIDGSNYGFLVCCSGDNPSNLRNSCGGQSAGVLSLSDVTNAHVEQYNGPNNYPEEVCLSTSDGSNVDCKYESDCSAGYECVTTISVGRESNTLLYTIQDDNDVWQSTNLGVAWTIIGVDYNGDEVENMLRGTSDSNGYLFIIESDEDVWKSTNSGASWTKVTTNLNGDNGDVEGMVSIGTELYAVDDDDDVWKSTNSGTSWTKVEDDYNDNVVGDAAYMMVDLSNNLYIVEYQEAVWQSTNLGDSWTVVNNNYNGGEEPVYRFFRGTSDSNGYLFIIESDEDVWKSTNSGSSWIKVTTNFNGDNGDVRGLVAVNSDLYAVDKENDVWKSTNSGSSWTKVEDDYNGGDSNYAVYMMIYTVEQASGPPYTNSHVAECGANGYDTKVCCMVESSPPPQGCTLGSATISANCGSDGICSQGETIRMTGSLSGSCPSIRYFQIDAYEQNPPDDLCTIGLSNLDDMGGINDSTPTLPDSTVLGEWVIPAIASDCLGKNIRGGTARIYDSNNEILDTLPQATGGFTFAGDGEPSCTEDCGADGTCNNDCALDPLCPTDLDCTPGTPVCTLNRADWVDSSGNNVEGTILNDDTQVRMVVSGSNCDTDDVITFKIYEEETWPIPDTEITTVTSDYGTDGIWYTQYMDDGFAQGLPEFIFKAQPTGSSIITSQEIQVNDQQTPSLCGDGVIDVGESCDCGSDGSCIPDELSDLSCDSFGFDDGTLDCYPPGNANECLFDTNDCNDGTGVCGDGEINPGESCDGNNFNGLECRDIDNFYGGDLDCTVGCLIDTGNCLYDPNEELEEVGPDTGRRTSWADCIDEDGDGIGEQNQTTWLINFTTDQEIPRSRSTTGPYECTIIGASVPFFGLISVILVLILIVGYYVYKSKKKFF